MISVTGEQRYKKVSDYSSQTVLSIILDLWCDYLHPGGTSTPIRPISCNPRPFPPRISRSGLSTGAALPPNGTTDSDNLMPENFIVVCVVYLFFSFLFDGIIWFVSSCRNRIIRSDDPEDMWYANSEETDFSNKNPKIIGLRPSDNGISFLGRALCIGSSSNSTGKKRKTRSSSYYFVLFFSHFRPRLHRFSSVEGFWNVTFLLLRSREKKILANYCN